MTANKRYRQLMIGFCVVVMAWSLAGVVRLAAASNPDVAPLDVRRLDASQDKQQADSLYSEQHGLDLLL